MVSFHLQSGGTVYEHKEIGMTKLRGLTFLTACLLTTALLDPMTAAEERLPGTAPWEHEGKSVEQMADEMVAGIDRFLLAETARAEETRARYWQRDFASPAAYANSIEPQLTRLKWLLGVRETRTPFESPRLLAELQRSAEWGQVVVGKDRATHRILAIEWPVAGSLAWEGLLIEPVKPGAAVATHILVPDAGMEPEDFLFNKNGTESPALALAGKNSRVLIPAVISREVHTRRRAELTDREYIYRTAFEMGRTPVGYEIQAVLALVDWLKRDSPSHPVTVLGTGEGGRVALLSAAVDARLEGVCVSGYFGSQQRMWEQPIDRNLFGYLERFGDAEVATLIAPRPLQIEPRPLTPVTYATQGGAPGILSPPSVMETRAEAERARQLLSFANFPWQMDVVAEPVAGSAALPTQTLQTFLSRQSALPEGTRELALEAWARPEGKPVDRFREQRQARLVDRITEYNQGLLAASPEIRKEFFAKLDTSSLERFQATVEPYRDYFRDEVIGRFDSPLLEPRPRSRAWRETELWTGYEVQLDVFPDVFAYGILLLPRNIKPGEQRPVVVCQHGLEGIPLDTLEKNHSAYHDFAARLADQGFVVFAPQNPYRGKDLFRTLQRKANPLGKTLFSLIVPQHEQITRWLGSLPEVDPQRIAFYGLSYGGKTAMRVPPLVKNYCLSICSADFNDWISKNVSTTAPFSYVWTGEYEIFEFDLGNTYNYSDMAALIAPRPFMVERGHFDGVGPDHWVASEFAKVRFLYQARLGLKDRAEIEYFVGPHAINGQGTFRFLKQHLDFAP